MTRLRRHRTKPGSKPSAPVAVADPSVHMSGSQPDRDARIAEAAYFLAEKRGFCTGHELDDWLAAEREVDGI